MSPDWLPLASWIPRFTTGVRLPQGEAEVKAYIDTALAWRDAGTAMSFATVRVEDGVVIGSTRFWNIERWAWPAGHARYGRPGPDVCEIGYTWLTRSSIRTAANSEAKLLMLTHAFEAWQVLRVRFHTDARNERSHAALERIGGKFEGIRGRIGWRRTTFLGTPCALRSWRRSGRL